MKNSFIHKFPAKKYCLDTNVLIEAWNKYYSPGLAPDYWDILNLLGLKKLIFISEEVQKEILRTDDDLAKWLGKSYIPIRKIDTNISDCLKEIYASNPKHKYLVDNTKQRSLADPWVIAHAMAEEATVVTKEELVTAFNTNKIKIPNVCENMDIRWLNDFQMLKELGIIFSCKIAD